MSRTTPTLRPVTCKQRGKVGSQAEAAAEARLRAGGACYVVRAHRSRGLFDLVACYPDGRARCVQVKAHTGAFRPGGTLRQDLREAAALLPPGWRVELWSYCRTSGEWREEPMEGNRGDVAGER